ncbi:MAG: hypothetical protein HFI82_12810 [Eubacterium sp.]|nr:hypothetical protein [Eubacterium sp.]
MRTGQCHREWTAIQKNKIIDDDRELTVMKNTLVKGLKKALLAVAVVTAITAVSPKSADAATKVKMDRTKVTCTAKETFSLKVKGAGSKKVKWSTTKKSVATVSKKGFVVTKKAGKATIKAKVGSKTVKCNVTVKKPAKQPWLTAKTKTLRVGESFLLIEGWFTDYESTFSFNDRIATVDAAGRVVANGVGTVKIMVNRGQDASGNYRDYFCTINVVPGTAKACKHNWMDARSKSGELIEITYRDEAYEECRTCGLKFFGSEECTEHQEATGHGGSITAGGGSLDNVVKFNVLCETYIGVAQQYCRTCGLVQ